MQEDVFVRATINGRFRWPFNVLILCRIPEIHGYYEPQLIAILIFFCPLDLVGHDFFDTIHLQSRYLMDLLNPPPRIGIRTGQEHEIHAVYVLVRQIFDLSSRAILNPGSNFCNGLRRSLHILDRRFPIESHHQFDGTPSRISVEFLGMSKNFRTAFCLPLFTRRIAAIQEMKGRELNPHGFFAAYDHIRPVGAHGLTFWQAVVTLEQLKSLPFLSLLACPILFPRFVLLLNAQVDLLEVGRAVH